MPVVMSMEWDGVTREQYEAVRKLVAWETNKPAGAMLHIAAVTPTGLRVTDLWASAGDFQRFVEQRLMPGVQQVGIASQPKVEVHPMHALFKPAFE
jgi:hypothetical protein